MYPSTAITKNSNAITMINRVFTSNTNVGESAGGIVRSCAAKGKIPAALMNDKRITLLIIPDIFIAVDFYHQVVNFPFLKWFGYLLSGHKLLPVQTGP